MAINFLANQTIDNTIKFVGGGENYATLKMVSQGLEVSVGDPANTTNPLVHFDGAYERVLIGSTTAANTPYLRIGGAGNQSSRLELTETTTGVGKDMNYGFSFNQTGNVSNTLEIKRHSNSTAGSTVMTLARDNSTVTFAGGWVTNGVSVATANVEHTDNTKSLFGNGNDLQIYHDGNDSYISDAGTGLLFIRASSALRIQATSGESMIDANENGAVNLYYDNSKKFETTAAGTLTYARSVIQQSDIGNGEGVGLQLINAAQNQLWNVTCGITNVDNTTFNVRNSSSNVNVLSIAANNNNATFAGDVGLGGTGLYTALHSLNIDGTGLAIKNDANGSNNNWSSIRNTATASTSNFVFTTGAGISLTLNHDKSATFAGDVTVSGGDITLGGTGRIQGVDTVSASTDAANKAYVDSAISGTGAVTGTGVTSKIAVWSSSTSIIDGPVSFSGNNANFAGNVGINEPSPDAKLHIKQANSGTVTTIITEDAARKLFIGRDSIKCTNLSDTATSLFIQQDGGLTQTGGDFKSLGDVTVTGDITVTGGDITLGGTGRIQGIDTVSASTDAANKAYVDANSSSLSGSGAGGRVTIWSGTNILSSDTQLLFDTSTNKLTSTLFQIPNNGDYLGTDTGGSARTLISLTSGNDVEVSNSALTTGSDTIIYFGDNFRVKDGSTNRLSISSNGTMSNFGNTFNSGPINLDEGNKIVFDVDGDNWNYIYANSGNTDMAVGGTLTLINIEENLFGDIKLENIYSIINGSTSSNATFIPVYTDAASSTVPRLLREQTPAQFLSNAGAITGAGASGRVAFFTGTRTQASDTLYWNSTQNALGINVNPTSSTAGHLQMPGTTNSGGKSIFINSTLSSTYGALGIDVKTPRYGSAIQLTSNQTSGSTVMKILRYTGTQVGSIVANNGSTSFNTSSDRRLKEKITKTLDGAGEVLDQLRPCRFTFVDPKDPFAFGPNVAGFIADELQEVVPDAVSGLAGEVDNNRESPNFGQPIYQQVDTTKLIPYLTQAIKDLQARVTSIEKRLPREPGPREFKEL